MPILAKVEEQNKNVMFKLLTHKNIGNIEKYSKDLEEDKDEIVDALMCKGIKIGAYIEGEPYLIFVLNFGSKKKTAYVAYLYIKNSFVSYRLTGILKRYIDEEFRGWKLYFFCTKDRICKWKNHLKGTIEKDMYQYIGGR